MAMSRLVPLLEFNHVDLDHCQLDVVQSKSSKDRSVLFPSGFRGELGQYIHGQSERRAEFLFTCSGRQV
jgi:hypothetical protein